MGYTRYVIASVLDYVPKQNAMEALMLVFTTYHRGERVKGYWLKLTVMTKLCNTPQGTLNREQSNYVWLRTKHQLHLEQVGYAVMVR